MWSDLGGPPRPEEIEVTLIGPGYGESILVHLGNGEWLIVDSCIDSADSAKPVAPLRYLRSIGVSPASAVKLIVASHWDDDHVRGIGEVVETCVNAEFSCSLVFPPDKFYYFVEALASGATSTDGASVRNIRKVLHTLASRGKSIKRAVPGKLFRSNPDIFSWSPSTHDDQQFLKYLSEAVPDATQSHRKGILNSGNLTSVVLSIKWPDTSVLLAADMEVSTDKRSGWHAAHSEMKNLLVYKKGSLVKIPHHGSENGHFDEMWSEWLEPKPISIIAPFGNGAVHLRPPKSSDLKRISTLSGSTFLTAKNAPFKSTQRKDPEVSRVLREQGIPMTSPKQPIGVVRHRKMPGSAWTHGLFGSALRIK